MASSNSILGFKTNELLLLGGLAAGAYFFILKKPVDQTLGGISEAIGGAGTGVSNAFQGAGQGVGDALAGVGGGIGQTFSEFGQTVGAGGDYIQAAAYQAQLDAQQEAANRRSSQERHDYELLLEQARLENERIKAQGSFSRETKIQNTSNDVLASFENVGKSLKNATGIPTDFLQGSRDFLGEAATRAVRGADIVARSANQLLTPAWDFYSNPLKAAQQAAALIIPTVAPAKALTKASNIPANASYVAGNDPKVVGASIASANASLAAKEIAKSQASKGMTAATPKPSPSPAPSSSSSKPLASASTAKIYNPNNYKVVVVNGLTRTVKR